MTIGEEGTMIATTTDWAPGVHLARVLHEEREASEMARSIEDVVEHGGAEDLGRAAGRVRAFLAGDLERHFAKEEADLFPVLARRGLEAQVEVAKRQHGEIRRLRARLLQTNGSSERLRDTLRELAARLRRHVTYEAESFYADLRRAEAEEYRADIEAALADGAGG